MSTTALAVWGAVLSTMLAAFRAIEFVLDRRPRLRASDVWRGSVQYGHEIIIINAGKVPASVIDFGLVWADPSLLRPPAERLTVFHGEADLISFAVPPYGFHSLTFSDADYFAHRPPKKHPDTRLFAKLWLANQKKPLWLEIDR